MISRLAARSLRAHKLRLGLTALAVILGVAFVSGTLIFTDTMGQRFDRLFAAFGENTDVVVRAEQSYSPSGGEEVGQPPIPESVVTTVRGVGSVALAMGEVIGYAVVVDKNNKVVGSAGPPTLGVAWWSDPLSPYTLKYGREPQNAQEVVLDETTAERAGYQIDDKATILVLGGQPLLLNVVGIVDVGNLLGATLVGFETTTAQKLLLKPGYYSEITVRARDGVTQEALRDSIAARLPAGFTAITGKQMQEQESNEVRQFLDIFRTILLVFAVIAVFVGAFIIFNTFSMLVAQRTRELALLRAVGASRTQVNGIVLGEALGIGVVGATVGLGAGFLIASALVAMFASVGLDLGEGGLAFTSRPVIWSYVVGIAVTVVAAYFPARRAGRMPPVAALRDDVAMPARSLRFRLIAGGALTLVGAALIGVGFTRTVVLAGAGALLVFLGVAMLAPLIARPVVRLLSVLFTRPFGVAGRLSRENALRNPRRTATTASALMIGLALVSMIGVLNASTLVSSERFLDRVLGADYILASQAFAAFSPRVAEDAARVPGVQSATALFNGRIKVAGQESGFVHADARGLQASIRMTMISGTADPGPDGLLVAAPLAEEKRWRTGQTVSAEFPDGTRRVVRIAGIYTRNDFLGTYVLGSALYERHYPVRLTRMVLVKTVKGAAVKPALESALKAYPNVVVQDQAALKDAQRDELAQATGMVLAMLFLSVLIAALGIVNTLSLSVIERTREIGLLRAVGLSRRQLRRAIRLESVVVSVFGALLGLGIGIAFGVTLQRVLADDGLDVLSVPVAELAAYVAAAVVIGLLAALWPAWRASRMNVLRAIGYE